MSCQNCLYFDPEDDNKNTGICTNEDSINSNQSVNGEENCPMFIPLNGEESLEKETGDSFSNPHDFGLSGSDTDDLDINDLTSDEIE